MPKNQLRAIIARRKAAQNKAPRTNPMLAACIEAAGYDMIRSY